MSVLDIMPSEQHASDELAQINTSRRYDSNLKSRLKLHKIPGIVKEKVVPVLPRSNMSSKFQDNIIMKKQIPFHQQHIDLHLPFKPTQNLDGEFPNQRHSINKYMSNVPGYRHCMYDRGEMQHEKALNFGVLDWERLKKWKHQQNCMRTKPNINGSHPSNAQVGSDIGQRMNSEIGTSSSKRHSDIEFPSQNIVVLLPRDMPKYFPRNSCSELLKLPDSGSSFDEKHINVIRNSFSGTVYKGKVDDTCESGISDSCSWPHGAESNSQANRIPILTRSRNNPSMDLEAECADKNKWRIRSLSPVIGRSPSPSCQFGIGSVGKTRRSFNSSSRNCPAVPQRILTRVSNKSSPLNSQGTSVSPNLDKGQHAHNRTKSSPLRRLLDPILKFKPSNHHSAKIGPLQTRLNSASNRISTIHAFMQFSVKNGLPLFKFLMDDDGSDILATTVKRDGSSWIYTFYSIREMKKGGSIWMNQGSKGKGCGHAYNVVGQMKISGTVGENLMTESILLGHETQKTERVTHGELAAIVTDLKSDKTGGFTVILPDGNHGFPNKGAPSPLIDRWKSRGLCDCGGWDVGCKLMILTGKIPFCTIPGFNLHIQGGRMEGVGPTLRLVALKSGIYSVEFSSSISLLQAFSICVVAVNGWYDFMETSNVADTRRFQDKTVLKPVGYRPYSPVGRV